MSTPTLYEILEDAESWGGPWHDGWGAVSGDEDDAPQDLFEETPDQDETDPRQATRRRTRPVAMSNLACPGGALHRGRAS